MTVSNSHENKQTPLTAEKNAFYTSTLWMQVYQIITSYFNIKKGKNIYVHASLDSKSTSDI